MECVCGLPIFERIPKRGFLDPKRDSKNILLNILFDRSHRKGIEAIPKFLHLAHKLSKIKKI
jgi:hypothetical protein